MSVPGKGEGLTLAPSCLYERRDFPGQPETCQVAREDTGADRVGGSASLTALYSLQLALRTCKDKRAQITEGARAYLATQRRSTLEVSAWRASPTSEMVLGWRSEAPWSALETLGSQL